ncbi:MAG: saccharopine dehydrogenase NADP-binding domain-containing protein [Niabella sp.]|nr:saccharopine dehydrogenase NADP-binding domain-containing protein [Niabella sp.]
MKKILLFGAGKSATVLIHYLLAHAATEQWTLTLADINPELAQSKLNNHPAGTAVGIDLSDTAKRQALIKEAAIVISMLPPALHIQVAKDCLLLKKDLLTASYIDEDLLQLKEEIEKNNLLFLCEMGLDPGIDHMSAMRIFDRIRNNGGAITSFRSHCGGLIAPESDNNPWHYKISWNPRNITLAGQAGAIYKEYNTIKTVVYPDVFRNCATVAAPVPGQWACYPNRDSLHYIPVYKLESAKTVIRTTLRHIDFCTGWQFVVLAELTNPLDIELINSLKDRSIGEWFTACLNFYTRSTTFNTFLNRYVATKDQTLVTHLFEYLGLFSDEKIPAAAKSSADVLQHLLETRLVLSPTDRDMILMIHEIEFINSNKQPECLSGSLIVTGENALQTAMAKTVGLPLAIAAKLILKGSITTKGLQIPILKEIYEPVLAELEENGVRFVER